MFLVCFGEHFTDCGIIVNEVLEVPLLGEPLLGHGLVIELDVRLCEEIVLGLITSGGGGLVSWLHLLVKQHKNDSNILNHTMCARNECAYAETEQGLRRLTLRACSSVHHVCHVIVGLHVLRVDVSLDLGFNVVNGVGRLNVQQEGFSRQLHFTMHTQHQVQGSFLLNVVVRLCPVIVHSSCIPNSCTFHIAITGLLRCCL